MPYFAHWKSNKQKKNFGYQASNEHRTDDLVISYNFEIWKYKKIGVSDVNFEI